VGWPCVLEKQHLRFLEQKTEVSEPLRADGAVDDPVITAQRHAHDACHAEPDTITRTDLQHRMQHEISHKIHLQELLATQMKVHSTCG